MQSAPQENESGTVGTMERVLLVCTGNTCRSPMAEAILNNLFRENGIRNVMAESAGTMAMEGLAASPQAIMVAGAHGLNLRRHRTRRLSPALAERASLILTMTGQQWYDVTEYAPREKVSLLAQIASPDGQPQDIPDPFGGSQEEYEKVFAQLHAEIERGFPAILGRLGDAGGHER